MKACFFVVFLFWFCEVFSAPKAVTRNRHQGLERFWQWDIRLNTLASGTHQKYHDDQVNYSNRVLKKPKLMAQFELQPSIDIKSKFFPIKWIVKPKLKARNSTYIIENRETSDNVSEYGFWENYLSVDLFSQLEISVGIINLQWGPSELINPSQFLMTQQTLTTEPFQFIPGIEIAQVLWTPSQSLTLNFVRELKSFEWEHSDEKVLNQSRVFAERTLLRGEYSSESGSVVLGQVVGTKKSDRLRWQYCGYGLWNYTDWTQVYTDYLTQRGSEVDYWDGTELFRNFDESEYLFFLGVLGHRWTFSNGLEWKAEWISNTFGKTKDERATEVKALKQNPSNPAVLLAFYQRNYIFPGQTYVYNSLRWDNPGWLTSLFATSTLYLRDLASITDGSHFLNFEFQSSLSDNWSQGLGFVKTLGDSYGELNSELDVYASYVLKRSF